MIIGMAIIFSCGYLLHNINDNFNRDCSFCKPETWTTSVGCEDDLICGDFGVYYFKTFGVIGIAGIVTGIILGLSGRISEDERQRKV